MGNTIDYNENTFKQYYLQTSDDEDIAGNSATYPTKGRMSPTPSLDEFFEECKKKAVNKCSSTVGRATRDGMAYVSSNEDDGANATHLIKLEILDLKKLKTIAKEDHWKHPDVRVKLYVNNKSSKSSIHHQKTRKLIYSITKEISSAKNSKKYSFKYNHD